MFQWQVQVQYEKGDNPMPDRHNFLTEHDAWQALDNMRAAVKTDLRGRGKIVFASVSRQNA